MRSWTFRWALWACISLAGPFAAFSQATFQAVEGGFAVVAPRFLEPLLFLPFSLEGPVFLEGEKFQPKVRFSRGSFFFRKKKKKQAISAEPTATEGPQLTGHLGGRIFCLRAELVSDSLLRLSLTWEAGGSGCQALRLSIGRTPEERFLGLGEQASYVEVTGRQVPIWVEEQGIGRGDRPISGVMRLFGAAGGPFASLAPMPVVSSTAGKLFFVHGHRRMVFDFTPKEHWEMECWQDTLVLDVYLHRTPLARLEAFTAQNGRPPALPEWVRGNWVGLQGGPEAVLQKIGTLETAGAQISAVWIQDWVGRRKTPFGSQLWWYWQADTLRYPDLRGFIAKLNARGINVLGYVNPFLVEKGPLFNEAQDQGYLVKRPNGRDYALRATGFRAHLLDFTNPGAVAWMKTRIQKELLDNGFSGWMADFGEWLPYDAQLYDGQTGASYHNRYPVEWARVNREAVEEYHGDTGAVFFMRAGFSEAARYAPLYWAGDQNVNWGRHDGIGSVVPSLLSAGLSGFSVNHGDVGGFTASNRFPVKMRRSRELLCRWMELGALSPVFRTHESLLPDHNLQVYSDTATAAFYARMCLLRKALQPHLKRAFAEATERGWPVARPLWLHYPSDPECVGLQKQFLLGGDLLVAPVVSPGTAQVRVYFPGGMWTHLITGARVTEKGWRWIAAPLGTPAVFVAGSDR